MILRFFGVCDNRRIHSHKNLSSLDFFLRKKPELNRTLQLDLW
ncbi:hypothetical protein LEP1GSC062_4070 [Leptospira alexanderi serovar Manhao 3 str. L 60]|uniref:Uncharacterized protein n=1 Tax=Leptospira alexanderi serovar Manhao 3 str. L 60 TaxID=1049759 RepID=V6IA93_9LEPT|nr:hypothetical protein LEP1GSC062_4070 [Leptospira alexanderi serovar Manhao 3 str. L 60]